MRYNSVPDIIGLSSFV